MLTNERSKHGCLFTILFGIYYIALVLIKWCIGLMLLLVWDWWTALFDAIRRKGHVWQCRKWFAGTKRYYYCTECGYNFDT